MKKCFLYLILSICVIATGCSTAIQNTVTQVSTIDALLAGVYDGHMSCNDLLKHGDFGIGTFDGLEGEMLILDGIVYQIKSDGKVYNPNTSTKTPFAAVCNFNPDKYFSIKTTFTFEETEEILDQFIPNQNIFCAIKITGTFSQMETRSVPGQKKPYPPLSEVTKNQPKFYMEDIEGTVVGFRCPPYVKGINVPGYHLHFLSKDQTQGGHILGFKVKEGSCQVDICNQFVLNLPEDAESFANADLKKDRSAELYKVEK